MTLRARLDGGVGEDNRALLLVGDVMPPSVGEGFTSSSVHCKWRITDFVAHCTNYVSEKGTGPERYLPSFVYLWLQTIEACCSAQHLRYAAVHSEQDHPLPTQRV